MGGTASSLWEGRRPAVLPNKDRRPEADAPSKRPTIPVTCAPALGKVGVPPSILNSQTDGQRPTIPVTCADAPSPLSLLFHQKTNKINHDT